METKRILKIPVSPLKPSDKLIWHFSKHVQTLTDTWKKPDMGWLKCNVDVAISDFDNRISFTATIRDVDGRFISGYLLGIMIPLITETISVQEALTWIKVSNLD
ncbi:hypothetical protein J1N35_044299 [Gossypium stocksii]|uniref:RNase H type-1 domain-containing protein n=1 Tax=Gossypium stocksii TaxID=47602 RepID=A0A9D3U983_9ROSI|nr:hypothetical protein J1N35_044299 [Gossypium stocksii]